MYIETITSYEVGLTQEEIETLEKTRMILTELLDEMKNRECDCVECISDSISDDYTYTTINDIVDILEDLESINSIYA